MAETNANFDWGNAQPISGNSDFDWSQAQPISTPQKQSLSNKILSGIGDAIVNSNPGLALAKGVYDAGAELYQGQKLNTDVGPGTNLLLQTANSALFNKAPEVFSTLDELLGQDNSKTKQQVADILKSGEVSYPAGTKAGEFTGMVTNPINAIAPEGSAAVRIGVPAALQIGSSQLRLPLDAKIGERLKQGGIDLATIGATHGFTSLLDLLSNYGQVSNAVKNNTQIPLPYKEDINAPLVEAQAQLLNKTGQKIPLVPEQVLENPGMLESGIGNNAITAQNKAGNNIAGIIEGNAGMPNQEVVLPAIGTKKVLPAVPKDIRESASNIANAARDVEQTHFGLSEQEYGSLKPRLQATNSENTVLADLQDTVNKIKVEEIKPGTGQTTKSVQSFIAGLEDNSREGGALIGSRKAYFDTNGNEIPKEEVLKIQQQGPQQSITYKSGERIPDDQLQVFQEDPALFQALVDAKEIVTKTITPQQIIAKQVPNKASLQNLYVLRKEVSDLAHAAEGKASEDALRALRDSLDREIDKFPSNVASKDPKLAQDIRDVNERFKARIDKMDNKTVSGILNDVSAKNPANRNMVSATDRIVKAFQTGDDNALSSLANLVGLKKMEGMKQAQMQYVLRGEVAPNSINTKYDLNGIRQRLETMSPKTQKYVFGKDLPTVKNLALVGENIPAALKSAERKYDIHQLAHGNIKSAFINEALSRYSNHPKIAELMVRKGSRTPAMANFIAKRLVDTLIKLSAQEAGIDVTKNHSQSL